MKSLIIMGTSRGDGNTKLITKKLGKLIASEIIELNELDISYYDYLHENKNDDFIPLAEKIVQQDIIILSTPVYWYTMSAQLKTFLDRTSDLITIRKDLGRQLNGKKMFVLSSGSQPVLPPHFDEPIRLTANYFGMDFLGSEYFFFDKDGVIAPNHEEKLNKISKEFLQV
ncbi:MAG: NAD(P)H-dependent oxidoreductase [Melioribacteraceae bacterium]|nr:NAD(P)H-dependent oxidoreductase [Melioribacteraceae bacterium]